MKKHHRSLFIFFMASFLALSQVTAAGTALAAQSVYGNSSTAIQTEKAETGENTNSSENIKIATAAETAAEISTVEDKNIVTSADTGIGTDKGISIDSSTGADGAVNRNASENAGAGESYTAATGDEAKSSTDSEKGSASSEGKSERDFDDGEINDKASDNNATEKNTTNTTGNSTAGNSTAGNSTAGNSTIGNSTTGNSTTGDSTTGNSASSQTEKENNEQASAANTLTKEEFGKEEIVFSGIDRVVGLIPGEKISLLDGVSAMREDEVLTVRVINIVATGDSDFTYSDQMKELEETREGASYRITYGAYDAEDTLLQTAQKVLEMRAGKQELAVKYAEEDYLFSFSGTSKTSILKNTAYDCQHAVSLNVERRDKDKEITEEEISNFKIEVTDIQSSWPEFVYQQGDTGFVSCDQYGVTYEVTYGVRNVSTDAMVKDLSAKKIVVVGKPTGTLPLLDNDDEYIKTFALKSMEDGSGPFDENDAPGNDSSDHNRIVRSYDSITYTLAVTSEGYTPDAYYKKGYIHFRFELPASSEQVQFDTGSMGWMTSGTGTDYDYKLIEEERDGQKVQVLSASKFLDPEESGISNALPVIEQTVNVTLLVAGMKNADVIAPEFYAWMDHNTQDGICQEHDREEIVHVKPESVTVSAAPSYNIKIENGSEPAASVFDFNKGAENAPNKGKGEKNGALFQYGISLELLNTGDENKGLRGIEMPQGEITFDIALGSSYRYGNEGLVTSLEQDERYRPLLWAAGANTNSTSGSMGRDVSEDGYFIENIITISPANTGRHTYNSCKGGNWKVVQEGNTLHVTVSDYEIDPWDFPYQHCYGDRFGSKYYSKDLYQKGPQYINVGIFSVGQFYIMVPFGENQDYLAEKYEVGSVYLHMKTTNLQARSVSGQKATEQAKKDDDDIFESYGLRRKGNYDNYISYTDALNLSKYSSLHPYVDVDGSNAKCGNGRDAVALGQRFTISFGCHVVNRDGSSLYGADNLMKFDDKGMTPIIDPSVLSNYAENGGEHNAEYVKGVTHTTLYAAKKDGTGWNSDEEMAAAGIEDMRYYASLEELQKSGAVCTGVLQQVRTDNPLPGSRICLTGVLFEATKNSSMAGKVCQTVERSNVYMGTAKEYKGKIPSILDWQNKGALMPTAALSNWTPTDYVKAKWENGRYIGGDNTVADNGDSLYLMTYKAKIAKTISQISAGQSKSVYDLDNGQTIVDICLQPSMDTYLSAGALQSTVMTITDVIPKGLSYNGDAVYGGTYKQASKEGSHGSVEGGEKITPVITQNEKGETLLTFTVKNVPVSADLPDIHYSVTIDRTQADNGKYFSSAASIKTTEDQREADITLKNMSAAGFRVVKLSGLSIRKEADAYYNNLGEDIGFTLQWQNFTKNDVQDLIMTDTMPFSGDSAGSSYNGNLQIRELKLSTTGTGKLSDYQLYYTQDQEMKGKVSGDLTADEVRKNWKKVQILEDGSVKDMEGKTPVVWCVLGNLPSGTSLKAHILLKAEGAKAGDVYVNTISVMNSSNTARAVYINRSLSGRAWLDLNKDGQRQNTEKLLQGVQVTLYPKDDHTTPVRSLGNVICTTKTNRNGYYSFTNLPAGDFDIVFSGNQDFSISQYRGTICKADNVPENSNSDAVEICRDGILQEAQIKGVNMPRKGEDGSVYISLRDLDAGFYKSIEAQKEVLDLEGNSINEKIIGKGTVFTYQLRYKVSADRKTTLFDQLPQGLEYVSSKDSVVVIGDEETRKKYEEKYVDRGYASIPDGYHLNTPIIVALDQSKKDEWKNISFKVRVKDDIAVSRIVNSALVCVSGVGEEVTNVVRNPLLKDPQKQVTITDGTRIDQQVVKEGTTLIYRITVENPTVNTKKYVVTDEVPAQTEFVSAQQQGVFKDGIVRWEGTLSGKEQKTLSFQVKVRENTEDTLIRNQAKATVDLAEEPTNTIDNYIFREVRKEVLDENGKSLEGRILKSGDTFLYKISFYNPAPAEKKVQITDTIPAELAFVEASSQGTCQDGTVHYNVIAPSSAWSYVTMKVRVKEEAKGNKLVNTADVSIDQAKLTTNEVTVYVLPDSVKQVTDNEGKDINGGTLYWDHTAQFQITYENPADEVRTIVIRDDVTELEKTARITEIGQEGVKKDGVIIWTLKDVAPHTKGRVAFTIAAKDTPVQRELTNMAEVTVDETTIITNKVLLQIPENSSFDFVPEEETGAGKKEEKTENTGKESKPDVQENLTAQPTDHNGGLQTGDASELLRNLGILLGSIAISCGAAAALIYRRKTK